MAIPLDPRPVPAQIRAWLTQDLSDAAVRDVLAILAADPNWTLRQTLGPASWDLALCYTPEGPWQHVTLRRQTRPDGPSVWHGVWQRVPTP